MFLGGSRTCAVPEKFFFQKGSKSYNVFFSFFLVEGGERIKLPLNAGNYRPTSETPLKWRFAGWLMMAQHRMVWLFRESRPELLRKPLLLWFFRGSGPPGPPPPHGSAHGRTQHGSTLLWFLNLHPPMFDLQWCLLWVCHFPIGILGQVWYLIVSIPDLCTITYFYTICFLTLF